MKLLKFLFFYLIFCVHTKYIFSITEGSAISDIAPTSLKGLKFTSRITIEGVGTETRIGWIDAEGTYWEKDDNGNGQCHIQELNIQKLDMTRRENSYWYLRNNSYQECIIDDFDSPSSELLTLLNTGTVRAPTR